MYFSFFPIIRYTLDGKVWRTMRDITVRARIREKLFKQKMLYNFYVVSDHSTPDDIATELYGSPAYHWIVLMSNDIIDPRMEWVQPEGIVKQYTYHRYMEQERIDLLHQEKKENPSFNLDQALQNYFLEVLSAPHHFEDNEGNWVQDGTIVSNFRYELLENDKKKEIRVLDPRYLSQFLKEFQRLMHD